MFSPESKIHNTYIKSFADKCDLCGCCAGICPDDAIEITETSLFIITSRCSCCSKCVWICPVEALELVRIS
jgi:ferredoxin